MPPQGLIPVVGLLLRKKGTCTQPHPRGCTGPRTRHPALWVQAEKERNVGWHVADLGHTLTIWEQPQQPQLWAQLQLPPGDDAQGAAVATLDPVSATSSVDSRAREGLRT